MGVLNVRGHYDALGEPRVRTRLLVNLAFTPLEILLSATPKDSDVG